MKHWVINVDTMNCKTKAGVLVYDGESFGFKYYQGYIDNPLAFPLDPVGLPLINEKFLSKSLFGVFRDASPDAWGRYLIEQKINREPNDTEAFELTNSQRVGCIGIEGNYESNKLTLEDIRNGIIALQYDDVLNGEVASLLARGSSVGGARPKATITHDGCEWIAKFNAKSDKINNARIEYATMTLGRFLGVNTASVRLVQEADIDVLLVKRFDRIRGQKLPYISALTATGRSDSPINMCESSYIELSDISLQIDNASSGINEREQWLRRLTYNVLCNNDDDHLRNHGFIYKDKRWVMAPAFDIMPHAVNTDTYRLAIGLSHGNRTATLANAVVAGDMLGVPDSEDIVTTMASAFAEKWRDHFLKNGVSESDLSKLEHALGRHDDWEPNTGGSQTREKVTGNDK